MTEERLYLYSELPDGAKLTALQELDRLTRDDDWWYEGTKDTVEEFMGHLCSSFEHNSVDVYHKTMQWQGHVVLREDKIAKLEENFGGDKVKEIIDMAKELASLYKLMAKPDFDYLVPEFLDIAVFNGRYDWDTFTYYLEDAEYDKMEPFIDKCTSLIADITELLLGWYVSEYDYMHSDEYKIEMAESNYWKFTEDGKHANY